MRLFIHFLVMLLLVSFSPLAAQTDGFGAYWYKGKAELNHYQLVQARYGELRKGDAVLIFVTEDFLTGKQVKLESAPKSDVNDATTVLKLNALKRFTTGIYDYSAMTSVFTPIDTKAFPSTLKLTTSVQDWCGQVWLQVNRRNDTFDIKSFSYFEREGDETLNIKGVLLEDELWTKLRLAPSALPTGEIEVIPSAVSTRLRHKKFQPEKAKATLDTKSDALVYTVAYSADERTLSITVEKNFPHKILKWNETYLDGFGAKAKRLTTTAILKQTRLSDYWSKNALKDSVLRADFGL
jgi:hypothetical protein